MRTRQITTDYSVGSTHGYHAHEIVEAIFEFGGNIWEASHDLLGKIESKDPFDGARFAGLVFDQLVGLVHKLDVDWPEWALEDECEKEIRSRVYGKDAPDGVVERAVWVLANQLQQDHENKISPQAHWTIRALHEFGSTIISVAGNCIDGQGGCDADVCWRKVTHAAVSLADDLAIYTGMSKDEFDKAYNDHKLVVERVINAINGTEDDVGGIELALQALDEMLTFAESQSQRSFDADGASDQASPSPPLATN